MSVKNRLIKYLSDNNIKKLHFEKEIGVSNGYINSLKESPSVEKLELISNVYSDLDLTWLLTGEGSMLKSESPDTEEEQEITGYYYPNVNAVAGLDRDIFNEEIERVPVSLPHFGKGIEFINVYGDSMYPRYNAGEIIGIKYTEFQYLNYGYPYVVVFNNGDVFIKYVRKKDEEHILLTSENPIYEPREFHLSLVKSFYSIRGVIKKEMM